MAQANQVIAELWRRGVLSWKLHAAQRIIDARFKQATGQLIVANCSRQFGKSYWAVLKAIEIAITQPKAQIRYGAAFQTDLLDFIIPAFDKVLEDCPEAIKGKYKTSGTSYIFPNGSRIKLVGLDKNPNGLRGNTLDLIILDEVGFVANLDYIYKSVIIPATTHRPNCKIILISTPPVSPSHDFVKYCQKAELEGSYLKFTIYDNPMVDEATIQRLMKESGGEKSTTWRREYLCEFVTESERAIIPEFKEDFIQDYPRPELFQHLHLYLGMDLGVRDLTAVLFGYYDFNKATLVIEDEITINGPELTTKVLASRIKAKEAELWGAKEVYLRVSDNNNLMLIQDMQADYGLTVLPTNKDSLDAMVNELRKWIVEGRVVVHPRCKQTIGCLKYGIWNKQRTGFDRSIEFGHFDALAALIYLVRNVRNTNPYPSYVGRSHDVVVLDDPREKTRKSLEKAFSRRPAV